MYKPHMAKSHKLNEQGWDALDSCRTTFAERSQPSHLDGQCKAPLDSEKSRRRNNAGSLKKNKRSKYRLKQIGTRLLTKRKRHKYVKTQNTQLQYTERTNNCAQS